MTLSGCTSLNSKNLARLDRAAAISGKMDAGVQLPDWPDYCRTEMPLVEPKLDEPVWGTQARWEEARDNENERITWCAKHYDHIAAEAGK